MSYGFFIPTVSIMGRGACDELPAQVKNLGCTKPLLVTDAGITHAGLTDQIVDQLKKDAGVEPVVFGGVVPNPTDTNVEDGLTMYKDNGCDSIISLGGGSVHDAAKGIAMVATNDCKIHELEGLDIPEKAMPPFIAINTTAGTASEMTRFCIITDTTRKVKMAIVTWRCTPNVAINDPLLMVGKPAALTAATGMDALTHAVEAFVSIAATPITDACAIKAISLIWDNLRAAVANGDDLDARSAMGYAEYLAGMAFNNASLGLVHAMAHQLGGMYDLPHGVCNAILLPHVERFNMLGKEERFAEMAVTMDQDIVGLSTRDAAEVALEAIVQLSQDVGIPAGLEELGVKESSFEEMAKNAAADACAATNPRKFTLEDIIAIFKEAM